MESNMKNVFLGIAIGAILVVAGVYVAGLVGGQSALFAGNGTRFPSGISTNSTEPADNEVQTTTLEVDSTTSLEGDVTLGGGDGALTITHSNTATSSVNVGCVETYATSTATVLKLMLFASTTLNIDGASVTAGFGGGTQQGLVLWGYGTCP